MSSTDNFKGEKNQNSIIPLLLKVHSGFQSAFWKLNLFLVQNCQYFGFKFKYLNPVHKLVISTTENNDKH